MPYKTWVEEDGETTAVPVFCVRAESAAMMVSGERYKAAFQAVEVPLEMRVCVRDDAGKVQTFTVTFEGVHIDFSAMPVREPTPAEPTG